MKVYISSHIQKSEFITIKYYIPIIIDKPYLDFFLKFLIYIKKIFMTTIYICSICINSILKIRINIFTLSNLFVI
jgi:hypothetical protein